MNSIRLKSHLLLTSGKMKIGAQIRQQHVQRKIYLPDGTTKRISRAHLHTEHTEQPLCFCHIYQVDAHATFNYFVFYSFLFRTSSVRRSDCFRWIVYANRIDFAINDKIYTSVW